MKQATLIACCVALSCVSPQSRQLQSTSGPQPNGLCSILESIEAGEVREVTLTGVYQVAYETQVFFDPAQPVCSRDVQPVTWIQVAPGTDTAALVGALKESHRVRVTFRGRLFGPGRIEADDPKLPFAAAFANRVKNARYGHLNGYRTKFVVDSLQIQGSVPESVPWVWGGQPEAHAAHSPTVLAVPRYPTAARRLGITGEVRLQAMIEDGEVRTVGVESGDRVLANEAVASVRTWEFAPRTNMSLTIIFVYDLEWRVQGDDDERIEFHLPSQVKIIGARSEW